MSGPSTSIAVQFSSVDVGVPPVQYVPRTFPTQVEKWSRDLYYDHLVDQTVQKQRNTRIMELMSAVKTSAFEHDEIDRKIIEHSLAAYMGDPRVHDPNIEGFSPAPPSERPANNQAPLIIAELRSTRESDYIPIVPTLQNWEHKLEEELTLTTEQESKDELKDQETLEKLMWGDSEENTWVSSIPPFVVTEPRDILPVQCNSAPQVIPGIVGLPSSK